MTNRGQRKKKKQPPKPPNHVTQVRKQKPPVRRREKPPKWAIGCLSIASLTIITVIAYQVYFYKVVAEHTWIVPQIVTNYLVGILFLVIGLLLFIGLFIKEERKKVSTYLLPLVGVLMLMFSWFGFSEGTNAILDRKSYNEGNFEIAKGVIEDYSITSTKHGPNYIGTVTINKTAYDISGYISIPEAKEGVGNLTLTIHYLPHSKWGIIVEFHDDKGNVIKVVDNRLPKDKKSTIPY